MKYIVTKDTDGNEDIFVFPANIKHNCMADALRRTKTFAHPIAPGRTIREPVSAGFVDLHSLTCFGKSECMGIESREGIDTELLRHQPLGTWPHEGHRKWKIGRNIRDRIKL